MMGLFTPIQQLSVGRWNQGKVSNCIEVQPSERMIYNDLIQITHSEELKEEKVQRLAEDVYQSLVKLEPFFIPLNQMKSTAYLNYSFLQTLNLTKEFQLLRQRCQQKPVYSLIATKAIVDNFLQILSNESKDNLTKQMRVLVQLEEQMEKQEKTIETLRDYQTLTTKTDLSETIQQQEQLKNKLEELYDNRKPMLEEYLAQTSLMQQSVNLLIKSLEQIEQSIEEADFLDKQWGEGGSRNSRIPMDRKMELMVRLQSSKKFKEINQILGRFQEVLLKTEKKSKDKRDGHSIDSIELGNKIENCLPSERMKLGHPVFKKDFYQRFLSKQLIQYRKTKQKPQGKGPIVACIDCSGSMQGDNELWSKAVGLGMLQLAKEQKRTFVGILYDHQVNFVVTAEKGTVKIEDLIEFAERFDGGGTNFVEPLKKAEEFIKKDTFKKADILFVSDGEAYLSDTFLKRFKRFKEEYECRCVGIALSAPSKKQDLFKEDNSSILNKFCDEVVTLDALIELNHQTSSKTIQLFKTFKK